VIAQQRKNLWLFVKQIGADVLRGQVVNLIKISVPVTLFESCSYLERLTRAWAYHQYFVQAAATADPVERMKLVVSFFVAGMHRACGIWKPFNPILGETWQAHFEDGSQIFCEQTSHHPPVSAWQVIGPDGAYTFDGFHEYIAVAGGNSAGGYTKGRQTIHFPQHNSSITLDMGPALWVRGVLWGQRYLEFDGTWNFRDAANNLTAYVKINPDKQSWVTSWIRNQKTPTDTVDGYICRGTPTIPGTLGKEVVLSKITGSWLSYLDFDNTQYWDIATAGALATPDDSVLPSDSRYRLDLKALIASQTESAQNLKHELEELQRNDARLRQAGYQARGITPNLAHRSESSYNLLGAGLTTEDEQEPPDLSQLHQLHQTT
jgi:hypothetical protein